MVPERGLSLHIRGGKAEWALLSFLGDYVGWTAQDRHSTGTTLTQKRTRPRSFQVLKAKSIWLPREAGHAALNPGSFVCTVAPRAGLGANSGFVTV